MQSNLAMVYLDLSMDGMCSYHGKSRPCQGMTDPLHCSEEQQPSELNCLFI